MAKLWRCWRCPRTICSDVEGVLTLARNSAKRLPARVTLHRGQGVFCTEEVGRIPKQFVFNTKIVTILDDFFGTPYLDLVSGNPFESGFFGGYSDYIDCMC